MYADDLLLVSSSVDVLQKMVNLCAIEAKYLDMEFNSKKSLILRFGAQYNKRDIQVNLVSERILVVDRAKYLGVHLESARRFKLCLVEPIKKYFRSLNGLLCKCKAKIDECLLLHLCRTFCLPFLVYGLEGVDLLKHEFNYLMAAYKNIFWKLFRTNKAEEIEFIEQVTEFDSLQVMLSRRKMNFFKGIGNSNNSIMRVLFDSFGYSQLTSTMSDVI